VSDVNGKPATDFDVVVIGGGMVGLVFAGLLVERLAEGQAGRKLRIALVEASPPTPVAADAELDLRVSALAPASRAILTRLGIWRSLPASRICSYYRMCVWQAAGKAAAARSITFDAAELGEAELGCIVENRAVRQAAWESIVESGKITLLTGVEPTGLIEKELHSVIILADGSKLAARLIVGADGAHSWVRQQLGTDFRERAYGQAGIVAHIATERPHDDTAWQRFLPDGPVAMLPLADGRSSLVWSCPDQQAAELLALDKPDFNRELERALDGTLGEVECMSPRVSFPLGMGYATRYTGRRYALVGDAAHRVHPLAGQGANLGLLDAAALAETLGKHLRHPLADPGDTRALRFYERSRKGDNLITMGMMDLLNRAFASPLGEFAGIGMEWLNRSQPLKNQFARYAMGRGRELPAAAQPLSK
jgi:ubiquinone biosynthesis UbiH/UbiF/VisC/COQ6 family hydroxylase